MKPSKKSPEIESFISDTFGIDRREKICDNVCAICGKPAVAFRDELSAKEYSISGMCQLCQDGFFGE